MCGKYYNNIATIFIFIYEQNSASNEQSEKFLYFRSMSSEEFNNQNFSVYEENTTYLSPWLEVDSLGQRKKLLLESSHIFYPVEQEL